MSYKSLLTILLSFFCFSVFSQVDTIPPDAYCLYGIQWIVNTEQDSISIDTFIAKDSYSPEELEDLRFSFSPDVNDTTWHYNCDHGLIGVVAVEVWVTDEFSNQSFCQIFVNITLDFSKFCEIPCPDFIDAAATVAYVETPNEQALKNVEISRFINKMFCETLSTNEFGEAGFTIGDSMVIHKEVVDLNGVSTLDVILIGKHVLGIDPINSPLELLAADIDNSGDITMEDAQLLARIITGKELLDLLQWKFIPKNYRFSNWTNPFKDDLRNLIPFLEGRRDSYTIIYDFIAIKTGDVDFSYDPEEN